MNLLSKLKELREEANYYFGVMDNLNKYDYYKETGEVFDEAINFLNEINITIKDYHLVLWDIMTGIGDGFGDDIKSTYLSKEDKKKVNEYLISKNLTT